jgi:YD repeat-containing protein
VKRLLVVIALLTVPVAAQQQLPGLERGLQPDKLYQFNGFDNVSVYSGNLSIRLPIGMTHQGDGGLSYQFSVNYNGKFWDFRSGTGFVHAYPASGSNAGLGWTFGFGRYIPENSVLNSFLTSPVYESPDGAQQTFAVNEPGSTSVFYAKDANLRLRKVSTTAVEIDFPDGTVQRHVKNSTGEWVLEEMRAPRGTDKMTVSYPATRPTQCPVTTSSWWRVEDGPVANRRTHYACFKNYEMDGENKPALERVVLHPAPAGAAVYLFQYESVQGVGAQGEYDHSDNNWRVSHTVALLKSVTLPDGSKYQFEHDPVLADLKAATLPTLARVEYVYDDITHPSAGPCMAGQSPELGLGSVMRGISTRTVRPLPAAGRPAESYVWTYTRSWKALNTADPNYYAPGQFYWSTFECTDPLNPELTYRIPMYDMLTVSVQEPTVAVDGQSTYGRVDSHFSVWPGGYQAISPAGFDMGEYSYPHGPRDASQNRHLSQEQYECTNGTCTKIRTTYARHVGVGQTLKPATRLESQRVVFNDDCANGVCKSVTTDYSDRDGYDHYRTEKTSHNFGASERVRTVTTGWNKVNGVQRTIGTGERWFPNTYEQAIVQENDQVRVEQACFDTTTGFMTARRMLKSATPGENDLVMLFGLGAADANLSSERFFGGDDQPLPPGTSTSPLCAVAGSIGAASPRYQINHIWQNGTLASSQYAGATFKSLDLTIDRTGLVTSARDTAGVETGYLYDTSGRIMTIQPPAGTAVTPGGAVTSYTYANADGSSGSLVPATATQTTGTGTSAVSAAWQFDSMGRIWREKHLLPDGGWSVQETLYDAAGRKRSVSEPEKLPAQGSDLAFIPSSLTTFRYDALGRTLTVTSPDQSRTRVAYVGSRETSRFTKGLNETEKSRGKETYDGFGRLVTVTEHPDVAGDVVTEYGYDAGGRLSEVRMRSPLGIVQQRTFDYDGRGLLRWEQHPESGMTAYTYDARGHVRTKDQSAAHSQFDLKYSYDAVERLDQVEGRNPLYGSPGQTEYRLLKDLDYATGNPQYTDVAGVTRTNYSHGKLKTATRYNYPPQGFDTIYTIADNYIYADALGRLTVRETIIDTVPGTFAPKKVTTAVKYNDLGLPQSFSYPMCVDCGAPPAPDRSGMTYSYGAGRLSSIAGFVKSVSFWPNGMRNVLVHQNDIADTQTVTNMPSPSQLSFAPYTRCIRPTITTQPVSNSVPAGGGSAMLSVSAAGSGPFTYTWFNLTTGAVAGYTAQITVPVSQETQFLVKVSNDCGYVDSEVAKITVNSCPTPQTGAITAVRQPDGSWILTPNPIARAGAEYAWRKLPDGFTVGNTKTLPVANLTSSTTFSLTISDQCGTSTATEVTIRIPLSITKSGLIAALTTDLNDDPNMVEVKWPPVAGATTYVLERRSGPSWLFVKSLTAPAVSWTLLQPPNTTYAYRVYAIGNDSESEYSNADVVTTKSFTKAVAGSAVSTGPNNSMLDAVNSVRAAVGWAELTWSNVLTATDPLPEPGATVMGRHLTACRLRMHEALQALGVPITPYAQQELANVVITAEQINEVQRRAQ